MSFQTLLYRYFFFSWLFKNVNTGDMYARSAAWKHNLKQACWLSTYFRRWLFLGVFFYVVGAFCEHFLHAQVLSMIFFVPMTASFSVNSIIAVLIVGFKTFPGPG